MNPLLTILLFQLLEDANGTGIKNREILILVLLMSSAGQQPQVLPGGTSAGAWPTSGGWDSNNPLMLLLLVQLLKGSTAQKTGKT
jgi:hypothetical protein